MHMHILGCSWLLCPLLWHQLWAAAQLRMCQDYRHSDAPERLPRHMLRLAQLHMSTSSPVAADATQHTLPSPHAAGHHMMTGCSCLLAVSRSISGLVAEYIVAIDVTRARFPADAHSHSWLFLAALPVALASAVRCSSAAYVSGLSQQRCS